MAQQDKELEETKKQQEDVEFKNAEAIKQNVDE